MASRNRPSFLTALIFTFCALMLIGASAKAQKKLKPGSTCELQEKITVRNKAQRKNVKTRQLTKGTSVQIVRYHRVWVRLQTDDGIAFATPKSVRKHCKEPKPAKPADVSTEAPKVKPAPQPVTEQVEHPVTPKASPPPPAQKPPEPVRAAPPAPTSNLKIQNVQVPNLFPSARRSVKRISPAAWVALSTGALSMGASAYFVSQLTTQDEATTGQAALVTGTVGIIGVIIGLSYILNPDELVSAPPEGPEEGISTAISVGPGSITVSGRF